MDDPDVDHELIALLRESLGFTNKAQDVISHNTGKAHYLCQKSTLSCSSKCYTASYCSNLIASSQFH